MTVYHTLQYVIFYIMAEHCTASLKLNVPVVLCFVDSSAAQGSEFFVCAASDFLFAHFAPSIPFRVSAPTVSTQADALSRANKDAKLGKDILRFCEDKRT